MFRAFVIAASLYSAGAPQFADYRPEFLDLPLKNLHRDINHSANEFMVAASAFKVAHPVNQMSSVLRFSEEVLAQSGYPVEKVRPMKDREMRENWALLVDELSR